MGNYVSWDSVISIARASELLGGLVSVCSVHKQLSSVGDLLNIKDYAPVVSLKAKVDVEGVQF